MAHRTIRSAQPRANLLYVRVSTDDQREHGVSLLAQEERLRAHAVALGREGVEVIVDGGESAKDLKRPGIQRILQMVREGRVASVTVLKLDRITRSVRDLSDLLDLFKKTETALVSVTESLDTLSAGGRLVVNMLGVVAQWERESTAERTAFALAHKRRAGRVYGRVPFGYVRAGERLVVDDAQQVALVTIRRMHGEGATLREVAAHLEGASVRPPRGSRWHATSVRNVLLSKMNTEAVTVTY